jgi:hypothetical protein
LINEGTGTVSVVQGSILNLNESGTSAGSFLVDGSSTLNFTSDYTLTQGCSLAGVPNAGTGQVAVVGGTLELIGLSTAQNIEVDAGGTVAGRGQLKVGGSFLWTGGTIRLGRDLSVPVVEILPNATLTINTTSGVTLSDDTTALQIDSGATANWLAGPISLQDSEIVNLGDFFDQAGNAITGLAPGFDNFGLFAEDSGSSVNFAVRLINEGTGTVSVVQGSALNVDGGGFNLGTFLVDGSSTLNFTANYTLSGGSSLSGAPGAGAGQVQVSNGATLTFDSGSGFVDISGVTLTVGNGASVAWVSGDIHADSGATIVNNGTFDAESDNTLTTDPLCTTTIVNNALLEKTGGTGTTFIFGGFTNSGLVIAFTGSFAFPGC